MKHAQEVGDNTLMSPQWLQDPKFVIGTATPDQMSAITKRVRSVLLDVAPFGWQRTAHVAAYER